MRTFLIRALAVLSVLWWFLPFGATRANGAWANPYHLRIVDQQTGRGIARVRQTSDNGIVCYTRADGSVPWTESALMNRDVSFRVETSTSHENVTIHVFPGGHAEIAVRR